LSHNDEIQNGVSYFRAFVVYFVFILFFLIIYLIMSVIFALDFPFTFALFIKAARKIMYCFFGRGTN